MPAPSEIRIAELLISSPDEFPTQRSRECTCDGCLDFSVRGVRPGTLSQEVYERRLCEGQLLQRAIRVRSEFDLVMAAQKRERR